MLSAILSSPVSDAGTIALAHFPQNESTIDVGGLDSAAFLSLHLIALGGELDDLLPAYDPVTKGSEEGPWVFIIPPTLRSHLASLSSSDVIDLARQWSECEELEDDGVEATEAAEILASVSDLARVASSSGEELLLWLSL